MEESFIGKQQEETIIVDEKKLAINVKSGDMEVLATPVVIALIEQAANKLAEDLIPESKTTVGTKVSIEHKAPTVKGESVTAKARLVSFDGHKIVFDVSASDRYGEVAVGQHERVVVDKLKFMRKALDRVKEI